MGITPTIPFSDADSTIPSSKSNSDAAFTAATFAQKYKDELSATGNRVSVVIKVAGESESADPAKRAKEIRYLQSYILKFLSFSNAVNVISDQQKNEITAQMHTVWIPILEKRSDVISVTIVENIQKPTKENLDKLSPKKQQFHGRSIDEIECKDNLVLLIKKNGSTPSCVSYPTLEKLVLRGWGELDEVQGIQPIIKTGTDAAFCLGYCSKEFIITDQKITYTNSGQYSGIDSTDLPEITKEVPFSNNDWNNLVSLIDFEEFRLLPNKIGCPGCADAPIDWIEITYDDETKRIEFERGDETPEIKELVLTLQAIRNPIESMVESFEECVAAGNPIMESYPRQCRTDDGKSFVEKIEFSLPSQSQCKKHGGEWLSEWNECEYVSEQQCLEMNGDYFECESACRHDSNAEICTTQCVPVCVIS